MDNTDINGENQPFPLDPVVRRAKARFLRCQQWESSARAKNLEDYKFAEADSDNGYQWPDDIANAREIADRPVVTINKVRNHNLLIINEAKKNKPGIRFRATGNGATKESADVFAGIGRHIEYISRATIAYDTATNFQVKIGIGYIRVVTDYCDEDTFDQEIIIKGVKDPLTVYMDPDIQEVDGSDARFGFVFRDTPKDQFQDENPNFDLTQASPSVFNDDWVDDKHVREAEYYEKEVINDKLISFIDKQSGQRLALLKSKMPNNIYTALQEPDPDGFDSSFRERDVQRSQITWYKIVGHKIVTSTPWLGKYIPIARVIGEETVIEGQMDRKGHTRAMKDPQRMYNYWSSTAIETLSLQTKAPWVGPEAAIEELETYWNNANKVNFAYLPYKHIDEDGNPIPPPTRQQPADMAPGYLKGMEVAGNELMAVSGQFQAQTGEQGNERSGKAINERQQQSDTSTYHYVDGLGIAIGFVGRIIMDLVPKVYDTERIIKILAEDGTDQEVMIDPQARQAYQEKLDENNRVVQRIFNPNVGKYEVQADIGPAYATRREEAFNAFTQIITQAPALTAIVGDILLRAGDFPGADEAATRLKRMVPPLALGQGPSQQEQQLQQQLQQAQGLIAKLLEEVGIERLKLKGKDQMRDIDAYNAETGRITALDKAMSKDSAFAQDPEELKQLVAGLVHEAMATGLTGIFAQNAQDAQQEPELPMSMPQQNGEAPPLPGAMRGRNGEWVLRDPTRMGRYLRVEPLAMERNVVQ